VELVAQADGLADAMTKLRIICTGKHAING